MTSSSADLSRFAEDPMTFVPPEPGQERIEDPRFVVTFHKGSHDWSSIERVRLEKATAGSTVGHLRSLVAERGRRSSTWKVGGSATPTGLADRLVELGLCRREGGQSLRVLAWTRAGRSRRGEPGSLPSGCTWAAAPRCRRTGGGER